MSNRWKCLRIKMSSTIACGRLHQITISTLHRTIVQLFPQYPTCRNVLESWLTCYVTDPDAVTVVPALLSWLSMTMGLFGKGYWVPSICQALCNKYAHLWFCLILTTSWELLTLQCSRGAKAPAYEHSLSVSVFSSDDYYSIKIS